MALFCSSAFLRPLSYHQGGSCPKSRQSYLSSSTSGRVFLSSRRRVSCAISMTDGHSGDHEKISLDRILDKARKYWDELPQPVKSFPWNEALENFIQLIFDTAAVVIKYLSIPLLGVSALSEMSYCAHQRKLFFIPIPLILGFILAGILKETALELSPLIKDAEVPWHLIATAIFFILLKLPGPYYPYLGRIFIPHFANGGLVRIMWMMWLWYRRPKEGVNAEMQPSAESVEQS